MNKILAALIASAFTMGAFAQAAGPATVATTPAVKAEMKSEAKAPKADGKKQTSTKKSTSKKHSSKKHSTAAKPAA